VSAHVTNQQIAEDCHRARIPSPQINRDDGKAYKALLSDDTDPDLVPRLRDPALLNAFAALADRLVRSYGEAIDLTVYRCVQESLTNVIRHAQANEVSVAVREASDEGYTGEERSTQLRLTVRDNGRGIDPTAPTGFGIRGMQERVQALGGSYKVESEAGRGTCVQILIPLDHRTPPA
jgi:signal transduction histidine kinase